MSDKPVWPIAQRGEALQNELQQKQAMQRMKGSDRKDLLAELAAQYKAAKFSKD